MTGGVGVVVPDEPEPIEPMGGDVGLVRAAAHRLLVVSAEVDDLGTFVAADAQVPSWWGVRATRYRAGIAPLGRRADALSLALRAVSRRVDAHADALASLTASHGDLEHHRRHLVAALTDLRRRVAAAGPAPGAATEVVLRADAASLAAAVRDHEGEVTTWRARRRTEERAMGAAFSRVLTPRAVERAWGGVPDPADTALAGHPPPGADPRGVAAWWASLTPAQRQAVVVAAPEAVGNLDGVPARVRDAANQVSLDRDLTELGHLGRLGALTDDEQQALANAEAADLARRHLAGTPDPVTGDPITAQVYRYDPRAFGGDGAVAVSAGDLDTADNVAVVVPGLGTDARSADHEAARALDLYYGARDLDPHHTDAVLLWIGYDAPGGHQQHGLPDLADLADVAGVAGEARAAEGGALLADTVDGLRAARDHQHAPAHLTVIGHSYGSTTMGRAAHDEGLDVDDLVAVGSPGLGGATDHASDLGIDPAHVWDGSDSRDPVAHLADDGLVNGSTLGGAGLGRDPAEDVFGGHRFQAESVRRGDGLDVADHVRYLDPGSESLANIAHVVNAQYAQVTTAAPVHDPWFGRPRDPEHDREPTHPWTGRPPLWN